MKKVLIAGADSYIGTSFEQYINSRYAEEFSVSTIDMTDNGWKDKDFSEYDAVFHVAGIAHRKETKKNRQEYFAVNRDLAIQTAEKARSSGVKQFIFLSSMSVYADNKNINITGETPYSPKGAYGESKLQADLKLQEMDCESFRVAVLRPPMVYGKGCKGNFPRLAGLAMKAPFFPNIKNSRSMIHIDNLCEIVVRILKEEVGGVFFPQNAEYVCTTELAVQIAAAQGKKLRITRFFNPLVRCMTPLMPSLKKLFGNLTYDKSLSEHFGGAYQVVSEEESINKSV